MEVGIRKTTFVLDGFSFYVLVERIKILDRLIGAIFKLSEI